MNRPKNVKIVEVGVRDGLQNEKQIIPTDVKVTLIQQLLDAGLTTIEAGSFVSPKWVPQMADSAAVMTQLPNASNLSFPVLVPNEKGLHAAIEAGAKHIAIFAAASETFSQRNINCSIKDSLLRYEKVIDLAKQNDMSVRAYVSCVLGCPYEGDIQRSAVVDVASQLYDMGCYEISLGDTIGVGTPLNAQHLITDVSNHIATDKLAVHFHDTYGQAIANIFACLELGVQIIDSSVAGLGGCPYAPGAAGNVATEDVLYLLQGLGIDTGIDLNAVVNAGEFICHQLSMKPRSKVAQAILAKQDQ